MAFFQRCKQRFDSKNVGSETVFGRTRRKPPPEQKHRAPRHKYGFLRRTLWLRYKLSRTCKLLCMLERGDCQIGVEPKEVCWLCWLDKYAEELCIFRCIAVHQGAHRVRNTRKTRELAASIFDKNRVRGQIYKRHFPFIENHFQRGIAGYEIDAEGAFTLKYLPSRFDKMRVPQMDIGIYEEHALLITKPDKVTKHYACAECQARFTKASHLQRHAEACTRRVSMVVCRGEGIQPLETAYEKAFYGHRAYAGKAVSWMEHEAQRRGVHIHHQMCGQAGERRITGYSGDGFCWETNEVFQFHGCHWHGWPECFPGRRKEVVAFEKTKQGRRGLTREMQFARTN